MGRTISLDCIQGLALRQALAGHHRELIEPMNQIRWRTWDGFSRSKLTRIEWRRTVVLLNLRQMGQRLNGGITDGRYPG